MKLGNRLPDPALVGRAWEWTTNHAPHLCHHGYRAHYLARDYERAVANGWSRSLKRAIARDLRANWAPVMNAFQAWDLAN